MTDEETSWQNEAIQQNRLLFDALVRAEIAEKRLAKAVEALREIKSVECEYCTDCFHQLADEVLTELEKTKGTSISTDYAAAAYHLALEKLEPSK